MFNPSGGPVRVFYSYSHRDESLRDELESHLAIFRRQGKVQEWHDRRIDAGSEWEDEISRHLEEATLILLLISSDFINSEASGLRQREGKTVAVASRAHGSPGRLHGYQPHQSSPAIAKQLPLFGQRDDLPGCPPRPEVVAQFVMRGTEARGCLEAPEPAHRVVPLLDAPMILFQPIVQIATAAVDDFPVEHLADGAGVGIVPICRHAVRSVADDGTGPAEETLSRLPVARRAEQRIDQVAIPIDGAVQVAPAAVDLDVRLIDIPGPAGFPAPFDAKSLRQ